MAAVMKMPLEEIAVHGEVNKAEENYIGEFKFIYASNDCRDNKAQSI